MMAALNLQEEGILCENVKQYRNVNFAYQNSNV